MVCKSLLIICSNVKVPVSISFYCICTGKCLDILAISCDSFNEETNRVIGRYQPKLHHLGSLALVRDWCKKYHVAFKINTVVNTHNWEEDMRQEILDLNPVRWKVCYILHAVSLVTHPLMFIILAFLCLF